MMVFVVVGTAVGHFNHVNQYAALAIATSAPYANAFGADGSNALVMRAAQAQHDGLLINEMFFGLWLLPLSYLVIKSTHFPRLVGFLLTVTAVDWIAQFFADLLVPGLPYMFAVEQIGGAGEFVFVAWLLIFGVRLPAAGASASAMATSLGRGQRRAGGRPPRYVAGTGALLRCDPDDDEPGRPRRHATHAEERPVSRSTGHVFEETAPTLLRSDQLDPTLLRRGALVPDSGIRITLIDHSTPTSS